MNPLTERLPEAIRIDGKYYPVNADYRTGVRIMLAFEDDELTLAEKQQICLRLLYKELPENLEQAYWMAVKFLNYGDEIKEGNEETEQRVYSWSHDAKYIYAAILQSHGIDLNQEEDMHWWKFCYLFMGLQEECFFNRMIYLRRQKADGKLTKEERQIYEGLKDILDLPFSKDEQQAIDNFMRLLNGD